MQFNLSKTPLSHKTLNAIGSFYLPLQAKVAATKTRALILHSSQFHKFNGNGRQIASIDRFGVSSVHSNDLASHLSKPFSFTAQIYPQKHQNFSFRVWRWGRSDAREMGLQNGDEDEHGKPKLKAADTVDAIFVLAGGQYAGGVPVWVQRRLDKAIELQSKNAFLCKIVCLGGGTPHKPPVLSPQGYVIHESSSCTDYLHQKGTQFTHLIKEWSSYDTIGNGYFSLVQHVIPCKWQTLAIITSDFHMPRTQLIFEWIYGLKGAGIQLQQHKFDGLNGVVGRSEAQGFVLNYHSVPDDCMDKKILQDRIKREQQSIKNVNVLAQKLHTLEDFHEWFHTYHKAYNTQHQHLFGKQKDNDIALLSY